MRDSTKQVDCRSQYIFLYWLYDKIKELLAVVQKSEVFYMRGRKRKPSGEELNELVRQLCGEEPDDMQVWMKLSQEDFEPFLQAADVRLLESPVISVAAAPSWIRRAVDELIAEAGRTVTHFLLYTRSFGHILSLDILSEIVAGAQGVIDMRSANFIVGYRAMVDGLKEGEVTLLVLASMGPKPQADETALDTKAIFGFPR